jgi:hypothetical protein
MRGTRLPWSSLSSNGAPSALRINRTLHREETMSTFSKLALAAAAALLASCATTSDKYHQVGTRMPSELVDSSAAWAVLDLDNDGSLALDEIEQQRAIGILQDLPNADTNHDHRVSKSEWDAWWPRMTDHYVSDDSTPLPLTDMAQ